jgi:hypothetical protein
MAALLTNFDAQSPKMALAHEFEHMKNMIEGTFDYLMPKPGFGPDDENVILGAERRIAQQIGEAVRDSSLIADYYTVADPTTKAPFDPEQLLRVMEEYLRRRGVLPLKECDEDRR